MLRHRTLACLLAAFVAQLAQGCGEKAAQENEADYDYGAPEMRSAIEGTWVGHMVDGASEANSTTLTLSYVPTDVHAQCGTRFLSADGLEGTLAPRCMDMSQMRVTGTFQTKEAGAPESVDGSFEVGSLRFYGGGFLDLGLGANRRLGGELRDGVLTLDVITTSQRLGRYSLTRVP